MSLIQHVIDEFEQFSISELELLREEINNEINRKLNDIKKKPETQEES